MTKEKNYTVEVDGNILTVRMLPLGVDGKRHSCVLQLPAMKETEDIFGNRVWVKMNRKQAVEYAVKSLQKYYSK